MALWKPEYVDKILFREKDIEQRIKRATAWIHKKYRNRPDKPIMIGILKGAIPFYGKLIMNLRIDCQFDFVTLSSFRGGLEAIGSPRLVTRLLNDVKGRDVIIIEDVVDTARTISKLYKYLKSHKPKSLATVALVDKHEMRMVPYKVDYACFKIKGNPFLIGYGLDVKEIARNLPYVATFKKEYLNKL